MSNKYIIKNCPALIKEAFQNNQIDGIARTTQIRKNLCFYNTSLQCENINDCVMKRIVELCKEDLKPVREWQEGDTVFVEYKKDVDFANNITNLLDIEECE